MIIMKKFNSDSYAAIVFLCGLVLFIFILIACNNNKSKEKQLLPDKKDINEIVKVIIEKKHLRADVPFVAELNKNIILSSNYASNAPRPIGSILINDVLKIKLNKVNFFAKTDSLYILYQNSIFKTFRIDGTASKYVTLISSNQILKDRKLEKVTRFYNMSIPIFSADNKKAYVELDFSCPLCGSGTALFLIKVNEKWTIVKEENLWVS